MYFANTHTHTPTRPHIHTHTIDVCLCFRFSEKERLFFTHTHHRRVFMFQILRKRAIIFLKKYLPKCVKIYCQIRGYLNFAWNKRVSNCDSSLKICVFYTRNCFSRSSVWLLHAQRIFSCVYMEYRYDENPVSFSDAVENRSFRII